MNIYASEADSFQEQLAILLRGTPQIDNGGITEGAYLCAVFAEVSTPGARAANSH